MDVRLDGKVAIVTGGAGGFGRAYCRGLAEAGATVAVVDVLEATEDFAASLREAGGRAESFGVDVTDARAVQNLVTQVVERYGGLDILLNIAGDATKHDLQDLPEEEWDRVLDLNLKGMYLCCKAAIPHLIKRGGGRIINMASSRGMQGQPHSAHYAASKGGVIALTKSLAEELRPHRITVNALAPGATDTPMWRRNRTDVVGEAASRGDRLGRPEDLAPVVVFLASDFGYQITGLVVVRDIFMPRKG